MLSAKQMHYTLHFFLSWICQWKFIMRKTCSSNLSCHELFNGRTVVNVVYLIQPGVLKSKSWSLHKRKSQFFGNTQ